MITMSPINGSNVLYSDIENELTCREFELMFKQVHRMIQQFGSVSIAIELNEPITMPIQIAWGKINFDCNHFDNVTKVAIIGDERLYQALPMISKPFPMAMVRHFSLFERPQAVDWLMAGEPKN